jgi:hypothetical protein
VMIIAEQVTIDKRGSNCHHEKYVGVKEKRISETRYYTSDATTQLLNKKERLGAAGSSSTTSF